MTIHRTFVSLLVIFFVTRTAAAADFATQVLEATFKFSNGEGAATCFFVRRDAPDTALYLVTAAHVFEDMTGDNAIVALREAKDDGSFQRRDYPIQIRRDGNPLWVRHETQDAAVLRLVAPLPVSVPALPVSVLANTSQLKMVDAHICSPLFILTYPARFEFDKAAFPVARQGIFATPPLLPAAAYPTFVADFTTFEGDSGGPVFMPGVDGHPLVVGIALAQVYHDEHHNKEFEERVIHHPLGLGIILHAQYIRDTLETASKQEITAPK